MTSRRCRLLSGGPRSVAMPRGGSCGALIRPKCIADSDVCGHVARGSLGVREKHGSSRRLGRRRQNKLLWLLARPRRLAAKVVCLVVFEAWWDRFSIMSCYDKKRRMKRYKLQRLSLGHA